MYFEQLYTPGLAHSSYILAGQKACLVVDPARDVDRYVQQAHAWGKPITAVLETHLHADFVSGHLELARRTGARIYAPKAAGCGFDHIGLDDGDEVTIDSLLVRLVASPGHTPEGAVYVVSDLARGTQPCLVFSGDTLLVGDVGRPDLFPDRRQELAGQLFDSLRRLETLGDHLELYPAHGMGSLCGRQLSAKLWSTIGNERRHNYALAIRDRDEFAGALLSGMPEAPDHFARCSAVNRAGPALVAGLPAPAAVGPADFQAAMQQGHLVIDTRDQLAFAGAHVPGAVALSLRGNFATFAGWVVPPDQPLLLVLETGADLEPALTGLRRVGLDRVTGYLAGGMTAWANSGLPAGHLETISVPELRLRHDAGQLLLVDTRLRSEYDSGHIENSVHIAAPQTRFEPARPDTELPLAVICNTGNRSVLAASLLRRRGFEAVVNVIGGTTAWQAAGYPLTAPLEGAMAHG